MKHSACPTCGAAGSHLKLNDRTIYAFGCTAELVVMQYGEERVIKACPDFGKTGRDKGSRD